MELAAKTRVGHYEIERKLGAGGMGIVYGAVDTRLGRKVALKLLHEAVRGDTDRLRRFEQEARTIGALNHPNLVTLHDVGHHDGAPYLVTELLDGQSLRSKLADGPLPAREIVRIAAEVARGLAAAHGEGVVHRDIKPDNLFVMRDGRVKILDFGIAKLRSDSDDVGSARTLAPAVMATAATGTGVVIGTPGYMAPEQLGGGTVDARTDIFAFGVVLFEMIARKRPFAATTGIEESYAIMKQPPVELPATTPAALARIVTRCLEKRPEARFQSAADLAFALDAAAPTTGGSIVDTNAPTVEQPALTPPTVKATPVSAPQPAPRSNARLAMWLSFGVIVLAVGYGAFFKGLRGAPRGPTIVQGKRWPELVEGGPEYRRVTFSSQPRWSARFAREQNAVIHAERTGADWDLASTEIATAATVKLGVAGQLFDISADGMLAVRQPLPNAPGGLLVTQRAGGAAAKQRATNVEAASFGSDDESLAVARAEGGATIEYPIGHVILHGDNVDYPALRVSRDGKRVAIVERFAPPDTRGRVIVLDAGGKELGRSRDYHDVTGLAWSPDDREVWFSNENMLLAFVPGHGDRAIVHDSHDLQLLDVARDGRALVAPSDQRVYAFAGPPTGSRRDVGWHSSLYVVAISDDGRRFGMLDGIGGDITPEGYNVYARDGERDPVPLGQAFEMKLVPDGSAAVLLCGAGAPLRLVPVGAGVPKNLNVGPLARFDLSAELVVDGKHVYAHAAEAGKPMRIWQIDLAGDAPPVAIGPDELGSIQRDRYLRFAVSPEWLAIPDTTGVRLVPRASGKERVIALGHEVTPLRFTPDGKALYAWASHNWPRDVVRIDLATGKPEILGTVDVPQKPEHARANISADGKVATFSYKLFVSDLYVIEPPK